MPVSQQQPRHVNLGELGGTTSPQPLLDRSKVSRQYQQLGCSLIGEKTKPNQPTNHQKPGFLELLVSGGPKSILFICTLRLAEAQKGRAEDNTQREIATITLRPSSLKE